jgi:hypothetical protein
MDGSIPESKVSSLSSSQLESALTELAGHLNAATHRWLVLLAEFDSRNAWNGGGSQSCAHWLNWKCGIDMGAAREKVRVAHALTTLPLISDAMARGQLSYAKVRALTRVACAGTEKYLLSIALHGTAQHVENTVRHFRRAKEIEELSRDKEQQINRCLTYSFDDDGSLVFKGRLPAESGALVLKALQAAMASLEELTAGDRDAPPNLNENVSAETSSFSETTPRMKRADALVLMAESFLANGPKELSGGDRHQVVIHVSAETLATRQPGCCEIEDGPSIAVETARRITCDASLVPLTENDQGEPLNIGRKTRSIPPALRRALNARDKGCRFPGCPNIKYVDAHHIHHWADGGETSKSNLLSLCRFHHRLVHEGGISVQRLDDGAVRFVKPDGKCFDSVAPGHTSDWTRLPASNDRHDVHIAPQTAITRWRGERMDYGLGVEVLLGKWRRGKKEGKEVF